MDRDTDKARKLERAKGGTTEAEERRSEGHRDVKVGTETGGGNKRGWGIGQQVRS